MYKIKNLIYAGFSVLLIIRGFIYYTQGSSKGGRGSTANCKRQKIKRPGHHTQPLGMNNGYGKLLPCPLHGLRVLLCWFLSSW